MCFELVVYFVTSLRIPLDINGIISINDRMLLKYGMERLFVIFICGHCAFLVTPLCERKGWLCFKLNRREERYMALCKASAALLDDTVAIWAVK